MLVRSSVVLFFGIGNGKLTRMPMIGWHRVKGGGCLPHLTLRPLRTVCLGCGPQLIGLGFVAADYSSFAIQMKRGWQTPEMVFHFGSYQSPLKA